jgi:NAD(P)-dependent dehydrogenase (short-subunit alcohol dehydrogenase family)
MAYSSTKFALEAYCDALRLELKDQPGIKIVSLNVGPIRTMIREKSVPHFDKWMKPLVPSSAFRSFYEKKFMPRLYGPYKKDPFELEPEAVTRKLKLALTCDATEAEVRGDCPDARVHVPEARAAGIRAGLDLPVRDRAVEAG